ncbi:MAG: shikimate kinase [Candidatus Thorarchaeota archaeon]|jgi:shikimate kinase
MKKTLRCICLIGFMGTGKTTIGKALASALERQFVDTDTIIEERVGKPISRIFSEDGETFFREMESEVVREVCKIKSSVISFGGGALLNSASSALVKENSAVVLLRSSVETIISRTSADTLRPLLNMKADDLERRVAFLLAEREAMYVDAMDIEIDTDALSVGEAVSEIIRRLKL